nr:sigma-70 family RNA polymerase sigma factor [Lysinibacter cavernae]
MLASFRAGNADAMDTLFSLYQPYALQHAARYASAQMPSEDIVSEAFIRVIQAIRNGKGPTVSLWWYLVTAMKSVAITHGPSLQRTVNVEAETLERLADEQAEEPEKAFGQSCVVEAFNRLPTRWQTVVWCRDVEGFSLAETAATLGISSNAVGALHSRARKGFRLEYLGVLAAEETAEQCVPFVEELASSSTSAQASPLLSAHLAGCADCRSKRAELSKIQGRFARALAAVVPGLFVDHPWITGRFGAESGAQIIAETQMLAGGAALTGKSFFGAAVGLIGVAAVAGTVMFVSGFGQASSEPAPATTNAAREALAPSTPEATTKVSVESDAVGTGGPSSTELGSGTSPTASPGNGRLPIIEVPTTGGVCQIFFEQSIDEHMAFFEQRSIGDGLCLVDLHRPDGTLVMLDSDSATQLAQASQAAAYTFVIETDVEAASTYLVRLSAEQVSRGR